MTPAQARAALQHQTRGLVEVLPVSFASHLVAIVCSVRPPPPGAVRADGLADFACRLDKPMWEAIKVLIDDHFEKDKP